MVWKNGRTTNRLPRWTATETWATIGLSGALVIVALAVYYGITL